jgi:hypothetical protein
MKAPRFEELAQRFRGRAELYYVFAHEAHPKAAESELINGIASAIQKMDADGDGTITRAEYRGRPSFFDAFDLDHDGVLRSPEFLAARRIDQFRDFAEPRTYEGRVNAAIGFRNEVPGLIPVLVDEMDDRAAKAYGDRANSAFVLRRDGRVHKKMPWANVPEVEAALVELLGSGSPPPAVAPPALDLQPIASALAAAKASGRPLLLELTAMGCAACAKMSTTTLTDPGVKVLLERYQQASLGVERDEAWALFEALGLSATPAFVVLDGDGHVERRSEGVRAPAEFRAFLAGADRP